MKKAYLTENIGLREETVLEQMYIYYRETSVVDSENIRKHFNHLNQVLSKLTTQESDSVSDITCMLCGEFEKEASIEGVKTGARLILELREEEQGRNG